MGNKVGDLYFLDYVVESANLVATGSEKKQLLWHKRYGHISYSSLNKLVRDNMVTGMDYTISNEPLFCKPCIDGKHHRFKFPKGCAKRASQTLELVHSDVCGKMGAKSLSGKEYFVTLIDDKSRFMWTFALKLKSDVFEVFLNWKSLVEKSTDKKLKSLRSDNGGEYISTEFEDYLKKEGIAHQSSVPKTPEQNGVAERKNRTIVEAIRSLLSDSNLPKSFWAEALATVTYLNNISPTKAVENSTPYEAWYERKPSVDHLKTFGCVCYSHIPKDERRKLDFKAREAIFLGYGTTVKGYRLYDPKTKRIFYSRDVIFDESKFKSSRNDPKKVEGAGEKVEGAGEKVEGAAEKVEGAAEEIEDEIDIDEDAAKVTKDDVELSINEDAAKVTDNPVETTARANEKTENIQDKNENNENPRRSSRESKPKTYFGEWANVTTLSTTQEPSTVKQALSSNESKQWKAAMTSEIKSLQDNQVWDLVELPKGRRTVSCKWIFKKKLDADGNVERYKSRLVARGFTQKPGIDYDETFSPVVRFESIRTVIAVAAKNSLNLHQMDVKTAFLNGELEEDIYMQQPEGFVEKGKENYVCKLNRSLYGLKQAARCWNTALDNQLKAMKFSQCTSDPCIYLQEIEGTLFILAVYVDDIILGGACESLIKSIKAALSSRFAVTDMGKLHHFLGVKVVQNVGNIWIGQAAYCKDLLVRFRMDQSNSTETPMDVSCRLLKSEADDESCSKEMYQSAVGSLLYLSTRTRPDISFAVGNVARFNAQPNSTHWSAVKRILRYIKGTTNLGLLYVKGDGVLVGYSDADWAGDHNDRKSTSGYVFQLSGAAVSWRSKKQSCVALSTAEAEYVALSSATQEAIWMKQLVSSILQERSEKPIVVYEDNKSAICMTKHQQFHGRSKHIDIRHHFVREKVAANEVEVRYCKSVDMIADILTKPLSAPKFNKLKSMLGMVLEPVEGERS